MKILPSGWIKTTLENVATILLGLSPPSSTYNFIKDGLPFFQGKADFGRVHPTTRVWCTQPKRIVEENTLLLSVRAPIGSVNITTKKCSIGRGLAGIKPIGKMETKFFFYFFHHIRTKLEMLGTGTTFMAIRGKDIRKLEINLPPLNEQKRIVSKIESIFSQITTLEESLKSAKSQMEQYKQSVLKLAFKGKLVLRRPGMSWECFKISEVSELIGGGTPSRKQSKYFGGDIVWLTPTEISKTKIVVMTNSREKITKKGLERSSAKIIPKDAVLLTSRASIGYVAIAGANLTTNQGFMSFVCNNNIYNYFLAYWFVSNKRLLEQSASGTTFKEISKSKMRKLSISMPSIPEQKQIVSKIESIFTLVDMTDEHITRLQATLATLRRSVLKCAFEGKLVPQNPHNEPANILLEKIRGSDDG